jgi:L-aminopeptidase/D-esterase-like protein
MNPQYYQLEHGPNNSLIDVPGVWVGHYNHPEVMRGSTAILTKAGALASVSVRGSNPGTIETDPLVATAIDVYVHGISLSGGSLFGLSVARGITDWCQEHEIGLPRNGIYLPVIPGAVIYDIVAVDPHVLPTAEWGYWAAQAAGAEPFKRGNVGAGSGGTAGKGVGTQPVKGGLGTASLILPNGIIVGALAVINSMGSPVDLLTGQLYARDGGHDLPRYFQPLPHITQDPPGSNTTLGVIATNCILSKTQLAKIADLAHDGFARTIRPMHTMLDGDTIFALSVPDDAAHTIPQMETFEVTDIIGAAAADAMVLALIDGFLQAESIQGFPAMSKVLASFRKDELHD